MGFAKVFVKTTINVTLLIILAIAAYVTFIYVSDTPFDESRFAPGSTIDIEGFQFTRIETPRIGLNAVTIGSQEKPLVIFLHGFPESAVLSWHHQLQHFRASNEFFVVAPDMRGYNQSDKPDGVNNYRLNELARDVIDIIDHYGKSYSILVGHDWGAGVAWWTAITYPERISKLAILNVPHPAAMQEHLQTHLSQFKKSWYIFFFQLPILPELKFVKDDFQFPISALGTAKAGTFGKDDILQYKKVWSEPNQITSTINYYRAAIRNKFAEEGKVTAAIIKQGKKVEPKTLIIWGKNDAFLEAEMAQTSVERCVNGKLQYVDASHWVQHEQPVLVNQYLEAFFKE